MKFRFPRLHRLLYIAMAGRARYDATYAGARFGNYSVDGERHRHFSVAEIEEAVGTRFVREQVTYFGVVHPFIRVSVMALEAAQRRLARIGGLLSRALWWAWIVDADWETDDRAYSVAVAFRRSDEQTAGASDAST
jgi:hypothetical protein